jgi:DNA-binding beta-propeller fold protein YncE
MINGARPDRISAHGPERSVPRVTSRQIIPPQKAAGAVPARSAQTNTPNVKLTNPARSAKNPLLCGWNMSKMIGTQAAPNTLPTPHASTPDCHRPRPSSINLVKPAPHPSVIYNRALSILNTISTLSRKSTAVGAVLHSERNVVLVPSLAAFSLLLLAGCGSTYRPVVSSINPVGPAGQPAKYAVAISSTGATTPGISTLVDFSGDTVVDTVLIGVDPQFLQIDTTGSETYVINGDGTFNQFAISSSLIQSQVNTVTLPINSDPISVTSQGASLYITQAGLNSVAQLQGVPPAIKQELPTGTGTVYTVAVASTPRAYALVQNGSSVGHAAAIETTTQTISNSIPVGVTPVYGVMTADTRRAFVLNKGSNTVTVINSQTNALDSFVTSTAPGTIAVGTAPVWADFAPTLNEILVANQGNGTTAGSVSIVSIPLCTSTTIVTNPNCDVNNPVDSIGFGQVLATIPVGINPQQIAVLQDGSYAFVSNQGVYVPGNPSAGVPGSISVINLTTNTVVATIPGANSTDALDGYVHGHPGFIAATSGTPTGKVYVTSPDSNDLTIIRTDTDTVQTHVSLQGAGVMVRTNLP